MAKVFLVDDNPTAREIIKELLEGKHEVVLEAASYEEAMAKVPELSAAGVQVAILDGSLGRSRNDGKEIAERLREEAPGIKIIASSGEQQFWGDVNLMKPYSAEDLLAAISKFTDST